MPAQSIDPRSGTPFGPVYPDSTDGEFQQVLDAAAAAVTGPTPLRAERLAALAEALDGAADLLVPLADRETALGADMLRDELRRTTYQLRIFADHLLTGRPGRPDVDRAVEADPPVGHPELIRASRPIGPVAVFGSSNFPFAFGVAGGDTASALAAGCPVVVKAHPAHPQTSETVAQLVVSHFPDGAFGMVRGLEAGRRLVGDDRIRAAAFTGSTAGGQALFEIACSRPRPIPFFGELGAVNPVFVTPRAAGDAVRIAREWVESLLVRHGQMCTNPGLLVVPSGSGLVAAASALLASASPGVLLTPGIADAFLEHAASVARIAGATIHLRAQRAPDQRGVTVGLVSISASGALDSIEAIQTECFGPAGVVIEYDDVSEARTIARSLHGALVATVHGEPEDPVAREFVELGAEFAGRVVWNGWPTGVAVSRAQHHGGPHPATTDARYTSVGLAAIDRFLRPVTFQNLPPELLPHELAVALGGS